MDINFNGVPMNGGVPTPNSVQINQPMQQYVPSQPVQQPQFAEPEIVTSGSLFTVVPDNTTANSLTLYQDNVPETTTKKGRKKKVPDGNSGIVRAQEGEVVEGSVEQNPTAYTYMETTGLLKDTLMQIDTLNAELMQEFEAIRHNRTMKNKYNVLVGLSENVGALINNRISVIREINSSISKSNDLDYKKQKDMAAAQAAISDDKYIADLYRSYISQGNAAPTPQFGQVDPSLFGSGIVRADISPASMPNVLNGGNVDASYLSYMSNLSPEQNLMRYENNPNVKQVVVYDAATGNRMFQMMNVATGEVITNVPVYDEYIMQDTIIDIKNKTARNLNINETFPLIIINDQVTSQY